MYANEPKPTKPAKRTTAKCTTDIAKRTTVKHAKHAKSAAGKTGARKTAIPKKQSRVPQTTASFEVVGHRDNWGKFVYREDGVEKTRSPKNGRADVILTRNPGSPVRIYDWNWKDDKFRHQPGYQNDEIQSYALHWANSGMGQETHLIFSLGYDSAVMRATNITGNDPSQLRYYKTGVIKVHQLESSKAAKKFNELVRKDVNVMMMYHTTC